jgi:putative MATE family efflux protein
MTAGASTAERPAASPIVSALFRLSLPGFADAAARLVNLAVDAYVVAPLGTDALAGLGLVLPIYLLIVTVSNAGLGLGVAGAVARALGAGRREDAAHLGGQAALLGLALGAVFALLLMALARPLFSAMGASDAISSAAMAYGEALFLGAPLVCLSGLLANVFRGAARPGLAALGIVAGEIVHVALAGPLVGTSGMAGAALANLAAFAVCAALLAGVLLSGRSTIRVSWRHLRPRRADFRETLPSGLLASLNAAMLQAVNLSLVALAAAQGGAALAGVALALRYETLMLPVVFALGSAIVALVGAQVGAGEAERAKTTAWIGAAGAALIGYGFAVLGTVGSGAWLGKASADPAVIDAARAYLTWLAPTYPFYAVGLALFFAAQGAGRAGGIFVASILRSILAVLGGWAALATFDGDLRLFGGAVGASILIFAGVAAALVGRADWSRPARAPT